MASSGRLAACLAPLRFASPELSSPIRRPQFHGISPYYPFPRHLIQRRLFTPTSSVKFRVDPHEFSTNANSIADPTSYSRPRHYGRRILLYSAFAIVFTSTGFLLAASPAIAPVIALMSAPTDAETLSLYKPSDDFSAEIDAAILNHPLAKSLRADPSYVESRPNLRIPEAQRKRSLTSGTLIGPGRITVPPLVFVQEGKRLVSIAYLSTDLCGHVGMVHGGLLATLMDEGLARCCFAALPNKIGVTAKLTVNYRAPVPAGGFVVLKAEVVKVEGRKAWVEGRMEILGDGIEAGKLLIEGEGLFVEPKYANAMPKLWKAK